MRNSKLKIISKKENMSPKRKKRTQYSWFPFSSWRNYSSLFYHADFII